MAQNLPGWLHIPGPHPRVLSGNAGAEVESVTKQNPPVYPTWGQLTTWLTSGARKTYANRTRNKEKRYFCQELLRKAGRWKTKESIRSDGEGFRDLR